MIKLVATDIDGTILIPEGKFTENVKNCIKNLCNKGIKVVLVTGRMHRAAKLIAEELNLNTPIISYQGGLIKENDKVLYQKYLSAEQTERIIRWAKKENIHLNLYDNDTLFSEKDCYEVQRYSANLHTDYFVKSFDEIKKTKINKLLAIDYDNPQKIDRLETELQTKFPDLYIIKSTPYFLEFSNKEASKYHAVKFLQNYWKLNDNEILTIGDQNNDIELLKAGYIRIAMENGTDGLKNAANYITTSVYNDGFVKAIEHFGL